MSDLKKFEEQFDSMSRMLPEKFKGIDMEEIRRSLEKCMLHKPTPEIVAAMQQLNESIKSMMRDCPSL